MNTSRGSRLVGLIDVPRHLAFVRISMRDALGVGLSSRDNADHLRAAIEWLCRAQDATDCGGVSGGYSWRDGWQPAYPETTGYTIPTFLRYANVTGDKSIVERAVRMADWEIDIQLPDGAVRGGIGHNEYPIVFNTGQVILGWAALYRHTQNEQYLQAARRAADWLVRIQDDDGKWTQHTFHSTPHAYHTRVAWPVLKLFALTDEATYREAARRHVRWVLSQANEAGWFSCMGFMPDEIPFTHTIAYTLRGLIECAEHLGDEMAGEIEAAVEKACERILMRYERRKRDPRGMPQYLPGTLGPNWESTDTYSCLTGNVQLAIVWLKLFERNDDPRYLNAALKLIDQVKATQSLTALHPSVRGAVAGSYPIWGAYSRLGYPNWAAKFLADAILQAEDVLGRLDKEAS